MTLNVSRNSIIDKVASFLFFLLLLAVMVDPTNVVFHLKDIAFIVLVMFNIVSISRY